MLLRVTGGNYAGAATLAAIARKESEFGRTSGRFVNNPYGYGVHLGASVNTAPSIEAMSRRVWSALQGGLYKGAGLNTLPAILNRYAPPSENNTALYKQQTASWLRQMGVNPGTNVFTGGGASTTGQQAPTARGITPSPTGGGQLTPESSAAVQRYLSESERDVLAGRMPGDVQPLLGSLKKTAPSGAGRQVALDGLREVGRPSDPSSAQAINAARSALGTPYSWGGGTPSGPTKGFGRGANTVGFDCSSLVQMAWAKAGVKLPRTTYDQIKTGTAVGSLAQARPGDLIFPHAGHVQMYLGNGKVIEAPRTGGHVQIVPVRSTKPLAIRRPG